MKRHEPCRQTLLLLVAGLAIIAGCGRTEPPAAKPEAKETTSKRDEAEGLAPKPDSDAKTSAKPETGLSPEQILQEMARVYKHTPTYSDAGRIRMTLEAEGQPREMEQHAIAAMVRPNQLRLHCNEGTLICDGKTLHGFSAMLPGLVLEQPAPAILGVNELLGDVVLANALADGPTQTYSWLPIQVVLLLADDSLKTLLFNAEPPRLLEPAKIDVYDCHRIEITRPDGRGVFWIDQKTHALRRFEYPVETLRAMMGLPNDAKLSLVADFIDASLGAPVDPNAFRFEMDPQSRAVSRLAPPSVEMLGKRSKDFIFVGLDNKPVTLTALAGKVVVLDFWATWCQPCRQTLPEFQKLREHYKDNDKVAILAVSVDNPDVPNADLEKLFESLGVEVPIYRDLERYAASAFEVTAIPTTVLLGPTGVVQDYEQVGDPRLVMELRQSIDKLLAGGDVYPERLATFNEIMAEVRKSFDEMIRRDLFVSPMDLQQDAIRSEIAEKSQPAVLRLAPLWICDEVEAPGNILSVVDSDGRTRLYVTNVGRQIAELDAGGKVLARHDLSLPEGEGVSFVRTARGGDGRPYFAGAIPGGQQVYVFDEQWKPVMQFPAETPKEPHAGIGDVQLADLDGDSAIDVFVGYRGLVGVKAVSLDGQVRWSERSFADVFKMAVGEVEGGRRRLFCTNSQFTLAAMDGEGKVVGRTEIPNRLLYWIAAADLRGDGRTQLCGLATPQLGENLAVGLTPEGEIVWNYELPRGMPGALVDLVVPGQLRPNEPGQWILIGSDGSLHVVAADGRPIDRFNYGQRIMGVAFAQLDGKPVLVVSTNDKIEAWTVAWPEN
ncbi:MAG: TlpA family protein disulfide reductase [Pirellulaceae bacterium]|nr:TlpA family protein disulfide reductase [Pirellulaceae bacterium]